MSFTLTDLTNALSDAAARGEIVIDLGNGVPSPHCDCNEGELVEAVAWCDNCGNRGYGFGPCGHALEVYNLQEYCPTCDPARHFEAINGYAPEADDLIEDYHLDCEGWVNL